jgi:ABC-type nitrate/sulfonate/bicarbonate transport system substrate-binding protein
MSKVGFSLLRGICQLPAYVAFEKGFFKVEGIDADLEIAATATLVPDKLSSGRREFAVMPWTRVAAGQTEGLSLLLLAGSGCEEAAIVVRQGIDPSKVRKVAIPLRGGIKDLTAMGLIKSLGWNDIELVRQPSGDGAILALVGQGADAASMHHRAPHRRPMERCAGMLANHDGGLQKSSAKGCRRCGSRILSRCGFRA